MFVGCAEREKHNPNGWLDLKNGWEDSDHFWTIDPSVQNDGEKNFSVLTPK